MAFKLKCSLDFHQIALCLLQSQQQQEQQQDQQAEQEEQDEQEEEQPEPADDVVNENEYVLQDDEDPYRVMTSLTCPQPNCLCI